MTAAKYARRSPKARRLRRAQAKRRRSRLLAEAREMHRDLIAALGGECVICGEKGETAPLTVDHEHGITWSKPHSAYRYDDRVRRYYEEYMRGVRLRCLCMPCNSGYRPTADLEPAPF